MSGPSFDTYDVSEKERKVIEWRHARRKELRHQYLKESLKPTNQHLITDSAFDRYASVKILGEYYTKVTFRSVALYTFGLLAIFGTITTAGMKIKAADEKRLRTGQVSYADRNPKFC